MGLVSCLNSLVKYSDPTYWLEVSATMRIKYLQSNIFTTSHYTSISTLHSSKDFIFYSHKDEKETVPIPYPPTPNLILFQICLFLQVFNRYIRGKIDYNSGALMGWGWVLNSVLPEFFPGFYSLSQWLG